jgi:hypothetical protein
MVPALVFASLRGSGRIRSPGGYQINIVLNGEPSGRLDRIRDTDLGEI